MPKLNRDHKVLFCGGFSEKLSGILVKKGALCTIIDQSGQDDFIDYVTVSCPLPNGMELLFTIPDCWLDEDPV